MLQTYMRRLFGLVLLVASGSIVMAQGVTGPQPVTFQLKAEPYRNPDGSRALLMGSTTYTLFDTRVPGGSIEKWRITLPEKPIETWVTPDGTVWVLADTTGPFGGPMSGRVSLWARTNRSSLLGEWDAGFLCHKLKGDWTVRIAERFDLANSYPLTIGQTVSEGFKLALKGGSEARVEFVNTENAGTVKLVRQFEEGQAHSDPLELFLSKGSRRIRVSRPAEKAPFTIWQETDSEGPAVLQVDEDYPTPPNDAKLVHLVRSLPVAPSYVVPSNYLRFLWFDFDRSNATLRFMDRQGTELQTVDLLKLGKYSSPQAAKQALNFRSVSVNTYSGWSQLDESVWNGSNPQQFMLTDQAGKKMMITLAEDKQGKFSVSAVASLNLGNISKKEPNFDKATLRGTTIQVSPSGDFKLRTQSLEQDGKPLAQLTLLARINDPLEGPKEVEIWSAPSPLVPVSTRVSDSGRVFAILHVKKGLIPSHPDQELVMLSGWDLDGKPFGGHDFASFGMKWFASGAEALRSIDLGKVKITQEGTPQETELEGLPFVQWPFERLDFQVAGTTKSLYLHKVNQYLPSIFYKSKPAIN